jgi:HK97 gp10 family phage protein
MSEWKLEVKEVMSRELEVQQNVRRKFAAGLKDCGEIITPAARAMAPRRTGKYVRSIDYRVDEKKLEAALVSGGKGARHAILLEYGTHKMPAFATMRRAAEQTRPQMGSAIRKRMGEPV